MPSHRFYIPPETWDPDALVLSPNEGHHARDVLRLKPGDQVTVFNGLGHEITAEIVTLTRRDARLRKMQEKKSPPLRCHIALAQAIPKGKNMELIIEKAVELGAAEIFPLISERTIVDLDDKKAAQKQAKWQQVAIEAAKQCGQNWLPQVRAPMKIKDFFSGLRPPTSDLRLIGSLQPDAQNLKEVLLEHATRPATPGNVLMVIGPEGDFTSAEVELAKAHGCVPVTLGPIVLRVETAAIYCLSVLSYELFCSPRRLGTS